MNFKKKRSLLGYGSGSMMGYPEETFCTFLNLIEKVACLAQLQNKVSLAFLKVDFST
jgi:hypothetical protein